MIVNTSNGQIEYSVVRSRRKTIAVEIDRSGNVLVKMPMHVSEVCALRFVERKSEWIIKKVKEAHIRDDNRIEIIHTFDSGDRFLFLGQWYILQVNEGKKENVVVDDDDHIMIIWLKKSSFELTENERKSKVSKVIREWYISQTKKYIIDRIIFYNEYMQEVIGNVTLRDQKTRWGSCSSKRNLNFNWRLIMTPEPVIDYVIIHEMCHLKHMNHSREFWGEVAKYCPDYRKMRKWLGDNQELLMDAF